MKTAGDRRAIWRSARSFLTACALAALLAACGKDAPPPEPAPTVLVAAPIVRDVTDWDDYSGRFEAVDSVELRPRVSGQLQSVHFRDGDNVKKGQLLFIIDPRPFAAKLSQSKAQLARAQAAQVNAEAAYKRGQSLIATHVISDSDLEALTAGQLQAIADVEAAKANVEASALDLEFTRVTAPIDGHISNHRLAPGNLVAAGQTLLTTLVTLDPIRFVFDAPESALLRYKREQGSSRGNAVDIRLQDEKQYSWKGQIEFVDNAIDEGSGTIRARALVENPKGFLTPGMFGHMRRFDAQPIKAMLIPDESVVNDSTRQVAYVVGDDGVVGQRTVELGRLVDDMRVIRSGLAPDDRVIISGVQRARPGRKVTAQAAQMSSFPSGISRGENSELELPANAAGQAPPASGSSAAAARPASSAGSNSSAPGQPSSTPEGRSSSADDTAASEGTTSAPRHASAPEHPSGSR